MNMDVRNFILLSLGFNFVILLNISAVASQTRSQCEEFQWKCKDGSCIASDDVCDGQVNCKDGSDETTETCLYNRCPKFGYRCAYGACVNGNAECNKVRDCADGSDELPILCSKPASRFDDSDLFECDSGDTIEYDDVCDGKKDCSDGSDEVLKTCASADCPSYGFQCAYGACINGNAKCNKKIDCADGSDELPKLCKNQTVPSQPTDEPVTATPREGCVVPKIAHAVIAPASNTSEIIRPGEIVGYYESIIYKCNRKHARFGVELNICMPNGWFETHPTCKKYCSAVGLKGVTTTALCDYQGSGISCDRLHLPGTRAKISCAPGYAKPPSNALQEVLVCGDDGEWDYPPFRCVQECGKEYNPGTPFIIGGDKINNTYVPWHVGIYRRRNNHYHHICGGTIINAKIVVSAAHCFWDDSVKGVSDISLYAVGAGKYYRDFYAREPTESQLFNISEIKIPRGYRDLDLQFAEDIAILVLNRFIQFREHIRPICMEWNLKYEDRQEVPITTGRVVGWGYTNPEGDASTDLRVLDIPTISFEQCESQTNPNFRTLITGDKFCAGGVPGETVCSGDSGGGFAIPKSVNGVNTYYLWGVVSNGLTSLGSCKGTFYTAFTNVQLYVPMLLQYETKYRPK